MNVKSPTKVAANETYCMSRELLIYIYIHIYICTHTQAALDRIFDSIVNDSVAIPIHPVVLTLVGLFGNAASGNAASATPL
jgi:hypothetical protein